MCQFSWWLRDRRPRSQGGVDSTPPRPQNSQKSPAWLGLNNAFKRSVDPVKEVRREHLPMGDQCWRGGLTGFCVDSAKAVVAHFIHQAVEEGGGAVSVNAELAMRGVVVPLYQSNAGTRNEGLSVTMFLYLNSWAMGASLVLQTEMLDDRAHEINTIVYRV